MATANAATFDGTNDFLDLAAESDLSGNANSKLWTGSIWFNRGGIGTSQELLHATGGNVLIEFRIANHIKILAKDTNPTTILDLDSSAITDTSGWHHLLFSVNGTEDHLYIDDVSDLTVNTHTDAEIDFTQNNHAIGATVAGSAPFDGCLAEVWIAYGVYFDTDIIWAERFLDINITKCKTFCFL